MKSYFMYLGILLFMVWALGKYPALFHFLFGSWIGNVVLFFGVVWILFLRFSVGIMVACVVLLLCMTSHLDKKEGFENGTIFGWPSSLLQRFQTYQQTYLPTFLYDVNVLQKQATAAEVESLLQTGTWPWSQEVQDMYKDYILHSYMVQVDPGQALVSAQRVYNQAAILELMTVNSKEGSFLLNGLVVGHTPGLPEDRNNVVVCDALKNSLVKKTDVGYSGIWGTIVEHVESVSNNDVEKEVNGFHFLKGPCNPCSTSCPFSLDVGDGGEISPPWKYIWNI
jgi:hypothetical protein